MAGFFIGEARWQIMSAQQHRSVVLYHQTGLQVTGPASA